MQVKIKNSEIASLLVGEKETFPKYSTQILNIANQNAGGTRPSVVGQMSDLITQFNGNSIEEWENWYLDSHPEAIENAVQKVKTMLNNIKEMIPLIDDELIKKYIKDLVINKTFVGLKFQLAILKKIAEIKNVEYHTSSPEEEAQGIDGFVGETAVSIKPVSYKTMRGLPETIAVKMVYYEKKKDLIQIEYDF